MAISLLAINFASIRFTLLQGMAKPVPFMWNGINYLVKMPSDLDFLNNVKPLTTWLSFSMARNPFIIPLPMEQRPGTATNASKDKAGALLTGHSTAEGANADPGFTSIGAVITPHDVTHTTSEQTSPKKHKKMQISTPYNTPVINDPDLISETTSTTKRGSPSRRKNVKTSQHAQQHITPSTIGDLDMLRLRQAEKVILAEEVRGRVLQPQLKREKQKRT